MEDPNYTEQQIAETSEAVSPFPAKPEIEYKKQGNQLVRFIISVLLFAIVYYFYAGTHWQAIAWLIVIIFIHEMGHYLAMKFFKYQDLTIFFIPLLGAVAGGSKEQISQREKAIVLLAGPLPGIIIGLVLYLLAENQTDDLLFRLSYAFVILNVLNLLPIYPLDGGQLLKTLFLNSREVVSSLFVVLSIAFASWFAISMRQWFLLIIPYFLIIRIVRQVMIGKIRKHLDKSAINYYKNYAELTDEEYWMIRDEIAATNPLAVESVTPGEYVVTEKESKIIEYMKSVLKTTPAVDLPPTGIAMILILWVAAFLLPFIIMRHSWSAF